MGFPANPSVGDFYEGWEWDGEKWVAVDSEIHANIEEGTADGQITTWAGDKWSPNDAVIVKDGNVGIGTGDPQKPLSVNGGILAATSASASTSGITIDSTATQGYAATITHTDLGIEFDPNASDRDFIFKTGNVGIGTATPPKPLSVWNPSQVAIELEPLDLTSRIISFDRANQVYHPLRVDAGSFQVTTSDGSSISVLRMTIDSSGDATFTGNITTSHHIPNTTAAYDLGSPSLQWRGGHFSGTVYSGQKFIGSVGGGLSFGTNGVNVVPCDVNGNASSHSGKMDLGGAGQKFKDCHLSGSVKALRVIQDGSPVVDSLQIIRAFMKLRDAVDDPDSTVEQLRDKLKVAVVDIIDQFQELVDAVEPEVSTMPAPEDS
jgi:hypothetical protein